MPDRYLALMLGLMIGTIVHEAGHWLVGTLLGYPIEKVTVGVGPTLYRGRVGSVVVDLRWLPVNGEVRHYPSLRAGRLSAICVAAAGMLGNMAVIAAVAVATTFSTGGSFIETVAAGITFAQVGIIAVTILPMRQGDAMSDGYQIVRALFRGNIEARQAKRRYAAFLRTYGPPSALSSASSEIYRHNSRLDIKTERADAAAALLRILDRGLARREETLFVLDALITKHLVYGDLGIDARLDELSARAVDLAPDVATLRGSRGAALVELGRHEEASVLLAPLAAGAPSFDSIVSQIFLARAEHGLGRPEEAGRLLQMARNGNRIVPTDAATRIIARISAEIDA